MARMMKWTIGSLLGLLLAFGTFFATAQEPSDGASEPQKLPPFKSTSSPYYPDDALRHGVEGKVLIAFDIAGSGRGANSEILFSAGKVFDKFVMDFISGLRFELPSTWENSKDHYQRYHMGFLFCIPPSGLVAEFGIPTVPVVISGGRLPGTSVRNPPPRGAVGQCAKE